MLFPSNLPTLLQNPNMSTTFPLFSFLPFEVRLQIWYYAVTQPRTLNITSDGYSGPSRWTYTEPLPASLSACHDSRVEALKRYKLPLGQNDECPNIYINFSADTLRFELLTGSNVSLTFERDGDPEKPWAKGEGMTYIKFNILGDIIWEFDRGYMLDLLNTINSLRIIEKWENFPPVKMFSLAVRWNGRGERKREVLMNNTRDQLRSFWKEIYPNPDYTIEEDIIVLVEELGEGREWGRINLRDD